MAEGHFTKGLVSAGWKLLFPVCWKVLVWKNMTFRMIKKISSNKIGVINDPLGRTNSSEHCFHFTFVLFC